MNVVAIHTNPRPNPRLAYTIDILNDHPFVKARRLFFTIEGQGEINVSYGLAEIEGSFYIPRQELILEDVSGEYVANEYSYGDEQIYSVELASSSKSSEFYNDGQFGFDLFEAIFFHLSRYEERSLDFSAFLSNKLAFERSLLTVKAGLEKRPLVDELVAAFLEVLTGEKADYSKPTVLSHDIDFIQKFKSPFSIVRKIAGHIRHRKSMSGFPKLWKSYMDYLLRGRDGFDTFDWMISELKIDKSIYFLVGGKHKEDNEYSLKSKVVQKAFRLAKERNYIIGIHPSYESWNDIDLIRAEKEKLEHEVGIEISISRQHFLNFDISITPRLLENLGIREDSSIGFTRYVGYRCGTGLPYKLYDFVNEKAFDVVEIPLVFMDVAWLFEAIRLDNFTLPDLSKYYGSFNFHNSTFDEMEVRGINMKEHYMKIFG
ncbi:DUF7033 domain-containing protein [Portibacter lacus]|uniref:DUF7033 domain-containing protein n=1 Tax=Portibacter lacus TaxID=1099794 RepID=A0AA37SQ49_9BACT|nr:hypothetical protein [Portibacter lacus]GLR18886.1 hypothetical protein GCM10007940_35020 [Portibacter lacus]